MISVKALTAERATLVCSELLTVQDRPGLLSCRFLRMESYLCNEASLRK